MRLKREGSLADLSGGGGDVLLGTATLTTGDSSDTEFSGAISGEGGLVKQGSGTFALSGDNAYTGLTTVSDGTLVVSGYVAK